MKPQLANPNVLLQGSLLSDIHPEMAQLLELLNARDQFDEIADLFERSSRPWQQYSQDERNRLVARAASMIFKGPS